MVNQVYAEAISETLDILEHTRKEDVDKISPKFMEYLKNNASPNYISRLDHSKKISDMALKEKTKIILAIIYRKFWCDEEQKLEFDKKIKNNELIYQEELREKYNPDNLFKNKNNSSEIVQDNISTETAIVEYKEKTFIQKLFDKIRNLFRRNN